MLFVKLLLLALMDVLARHVLSPIDLIEVCQSGPEHQLIGAGVGKGCLDKVVYI